MNLISFKGLNCYQSCIISIAQYFGIEYSLAFSSLWSEVDFLYENYFQIYSSRRMLINMETLGLKVEKNLSVSPEQAKEKFDMLVNKRMAIIGIDAYFLPWSPIYKLAHEKHYLIIQKKSSSTLSCFDPSYKEENAKMAYMDIAPFIFDLRSLELVKKQSLGITHMQEAKAIIRDQPVTQQKITEKIKTCENNEELLMLGRYIDAMINNRHLYHYYLNTALSSDDYFNEGYFYRWNCVKNGLFKAFLLKKHDKILEEVVLLFHELMNEELEMAKTMLL